MKTLSKFLDTYILIFFVVIVASALTYIIPKGQFQTKKIQYEYNGKTKTKTILLADSFELLKDKNGKVKKDGVPVFAPNGEIGVFNYAFEGLVSGTKWGSAIGIIAFILLIGGAFGVVIRTGAIDTGLLAMITRTKRRDYLIISVMFILFSLGGAIFGMGEETLPFVMLLVPFFIRMGYDSVLAILTTFFATQIGFATSWMNPFSVAIAQGVSGVPVLSGSKFRFIMWLFFTAISLIYVLLYAKRVKKNPKSSLAYQTDKTFNIESQGFKHKNFNIGHGLVIFTVFATMAWVLWGVMIKGYYIPEMATQFFIMGIVAGVIGVIFKLDGMDITAIPESFRKGIQDLVGVALIVAMAKGIVLILGGDNPSQPSVLNTILFYMGNAISFLPSYVAAWFMYVFQTIFNFFVVSGSGQAALTMPIMAPLSDLVHVSRQTAVLAFQLGDGFTNLIVPTSGVLMGVIGIAKIKWINWIKIQFKFQLLLFSLSSIIVMLAVFMGF